MENAHGWYDFINPGSATAGPGNINAEIWAELLDVDPAQVRSYSTTNIRLTAKILSEIQDRLIKGGAESLGGEFFLADAWLVHKCWTAGQIGAQAAARDAVDTQQDHGTA